MNKPDLSLVMPLFNEAAGVRMVVEALIKHLRAASINYELILINNGSTDTTQQVIESLAENDAGIRPLHLKTNAGYGGGILAGLNHASAPVLGYLWGDDQISPYVVIQAWRMIRDKGFDMAKARRKVRLDGLSRFLITRAYHRAVSFLLPCPSTDINGCPKLFTRQAFERLAPKSVDWFIDAEIMFKAYQLGLCIHEIDVVAWPRTKGRSKVRWETLGEFAVNLARYRLRQGPPSKTC